MELLNFINNHPDNWQALLAAEPYFLSIKQDGCYFILKYTQFQSDFNFNLVREARGAIFRYDEESQNWICVCYPFDKFFNYGEEYSDARLIDWERVYVQQKVDGSLIKIWYDQEQWHISTNGSIDAYKAECGDTTYGELVDRAIANMPDFWYKLDTSYCYMFELTSSYNRIVIQYDGISLWYLGCRNISNQNESRKHLNVKGLRYPKMYPYHSLAECVAAAHEMGDDEEGYVVCDRDFHRIKIKGDEYLRLHKLRGNSALTAVRVVEMWQSDSLDDFMAYYPEYNDFINDIISKINNLIELAKLAFYSRSYTGDRKDFAMHATGYIAPIKAYLFARLDDKIDNPISFFKKMRARNLVSYLDLRQNTIGVAEDE